MTSPNWRAYAAMIRDEARRALEGRADRDPVEREAGADTHVDPDVREVYEESLTGRLTPAIRLQRRRRFADK